MKTKKCFTLIEVLVSLTVFTVLFLISLTIYGSTATKAKDQKSYTYFESICLDIDKFYDKYNKDWDNYYYSIHNDSVSIYYDENYQITDQYNAYYILSYHYDEDEHLRINVQQDSGYIIEDLNYGESKKG